MPEPFWQRLRLEQLSRQQWESLCDGCGYCCLVKLEDEDSGEIVLTRVSCQLLDTHSCRCRDYANRLERVPMCVQLTAQTLPEILAKQNWLPPTCAYRLLAEGKPLPRWHPLVSGDADSVHQAGASVRCFAVSEEHIHDEQLADCILDDDEITG